MSDLEPHIMLEEPRPGVCLVRLNRPARLNAMTREMVKDLNATLDRIASDDTIRAVILTGAGRGFCAGLDVAAADARNRHAPSGVVEKMYWQEQFTGVGQRIRSMPQFVLAAVNGPCAGTGMAMALAADVRIAARSARFMVASVRLGLTAGESGISYFLPRLIGAARAFDIMLTGRPVDAEEAGRIGLCAQITEDDALSAAADTYVDLVLANSPYAIRHTKRVMWSSVDAADYDSAVEIENRTQILGSMTEDYKEATAAFTEKRPPSFTGR